MYRFSQEPRSEEKPDYRRLRVWGLRSLGLLVSASLLYLGFETLWAFLHRIPFHFSEPKEYSVGKHGEIPNSIAVAYLRRGGPLDLVTANQSSKDPNTPFGNVSVLLGKGDGSFEEPIIYAAGHTPYAVIIDDFNGDGNLDLAVSNVGIREGIMPTREGSSISVLLGKGDGTFYPAQNYDAGINPTELAQGDFNGDGKIDLVVGSWRNNKISVLLGRGDGTFDPPGNMKSKSVQPIG